MERATTPREAREIMGENILGTIEAKALLERMSVCGIDEPSVPYSLSQLRSLASSYLLVLGQPVTLRDMRDVFGCDPNIQEPCFYNQDWYLGEGFMDVPMSPEWYLIQKDVAPDSRAILPSELQSQGIQFPKAVQCTYAFFAYYFLTCGTKLWEYDFVWCSDVDHNGDRIYVGKYTDIDGMNKPGFSIHRHLSLRPCYGAISCL